MASIELSPPLKGSIELGIVPGIPGPAGRDAVSGDLTVQAADNIGGNRIVSLDENGKATIATNTVGSLLRIAGMTLHAANKDSPVLVRRNGMVEDSSWTWTPDSRLYLGANGVLTSIPPSSGPIIIIGVALSPTRIMLSPQTLIERA